MTEWMDIWNQILFPAPSRVAGLLAWERLRTCNRKTPTAEDDATPEEVDGRRRSVMDDQYIIFFFEHPEDICWSIKHVLIGVGYCFPDLWPLQIRIASTLWISWPLFSSCTAPQKPHPPYTPPGMQFTGTTYGESRLKWPAALPFHQPDPHQCICLDKTRVQILLFPFWAKQQERRGESKYVSKWSWPAKDQIVWDI